MSTKNRDPTSSASAEVEPRTVTYAEFAGTKRTESSTGQEPLPVCFYGRISSDLQNLASIDSQRSIVMKYIAESSVPMRCVMEYVDEFLSGKSDARPAFRRMISDAKAGVFKIILCYKQDRISRNLGDFIHYKSLLEDEYGVKIMYHSDGAVMDAVPGLIDMGIDILEALQFDARGMDPSLLKERYGDRLCFHGGVSVQHTLPYGSADDVREEVSGLIRALGKNGGYIVAPAHAIQAGTPPENIAAFLSAATGRE